jgi:hypothetical protein
MQMNNITKFLRPNILPAVALLTLILGGHNLSGQSVSQASKEKSRSLQLIRQVDYVDNAAREPMIVEHPNGTLFVSGYEASANQTTPRLWKSTDHGISWQPVSVGTEAEGASANSDVDLAVAPDGTLYLVSMWFDLKTNEGAHIVVGTSADGGNTWHWTMLSKKRFDDRPWVKVAGDGTAHVIWNDGSGVYHTMSRDRGITWSTPQKISSEGGSSHLAVAPNGEVAVRIVPPSASGNKFSEGVDLLVVSTDGGINWGKKTVPGERNWAARIRTPGATPRWVEPIAWDARGRLNLLWTQVDGVWLGLSEDWATTWKTWRIAESKGDALSYFPYLIARGSGQLAATWHSGAATNLSWRVCAIDIPSDGSVPQTRCSTRLQMDSWTKRDAEKGYAPERSTAGEYLPVLFLHDGDLAVVTPIQNSTTNHFGFSFWRFKGSQ